MICNCIDIQVISTHNIQSTTQTQLELNNQLVESSRSGNADQVRSMLVRGAQINSTLSNDTMQQTSLHWAAVNGHIEVVSILIDQGADTSIRRV